MDIITPNIDAISSTAHKIIQSSKAITYDQAIDPSKIIFAVGENHFQINQTFFQVELFKEIKKIYGGCTVGSELPSNFFTSEFDIFKTLYQGKSWPDEVINFSSIKNVHYPKTTYQLSHHYLVCVLPTVAALENCSYFNIDAPKNPSDDYMEKLTNDLKKDFPNQNLYQNILTQYSHMQKHRYSDYQMHIPKTNFRDVVMSKNTLDITKANNGLSTPIMISVGSNHLADEDYKREVTTLTCLLENGCYVVPVITGAINNFSRIKTMSTWRQTEKDLSFEQKSHLLPGYYIELPQNSLESLNYLKPQDIVQQFQQLQSNQKLEF